MLQNAMQAPHAAKDRAVPNDKCNGDNDGGQWQGHTQDMIPASDGLN